MARLCNVGLDFGMGKDGPKCKKVATHYVNVKGEKLYRCEQHAKNLSKIYGNKVWKIK